MTSLSFRPLPLWPHKPTNPRQWARFDTPYPRTVALLIREVELLGGKGDITIGVGLSETDIRLDGQPRANARAMSHPGVEISFESKVGRLSYATDQYSEWQDNVRAIAVSLEALRAVERWGVSKGRQYTGFALLEAGPPVETVGARLVDEYGSVKKALQATHPDTGSAKHTMSDYQAVLAFRQAQSA